MKMSTETPPTKTNIGLLTRLMLATGMNQTLTEKSVASTTYSSNKKQVRPVSQSKRVSIQETSPTNQVRENSITDGKTPGKIFASSNYQTSNEMNVYSNLMKNLSPQFKAAMNST